MNRAVVFTLILAMLLAVVGSGGAFAAQEYRYGDVDGNQRLDASDALLVLQHSVGLRVLTEEAFVCADVNDSATVDASDALLILQRSVGLPAVFLADAMEDSGMFPYFSRGNSLGVYDSGLSNIEYAFTGVAGEDYLSYRALLEKKGYTLCSQNAIGNNLFAAYRGEHGLLYTYYAAAMQTVRIIDDPVSPVEEIADQPQEKLCELSLAQLNLSYPLGSFGMCYVITLEDGRFVIIDGGYDVMGEDHERLYQYLNLRNVRQDGIVIAAWFLTHEDEDHYTAIHNFAVDYAGQVTLERFFINTPATAAWYTSAHLQGDLALYGNVELVVPHTGQRFSMGGALFEILYTDEDWFPREGQNNNECSLVMRMTAGGQTVLFPGDIEEDASDIVCAMYKSYLKSDIVQAAHHGYYLNTATKEFYELVNPSVVLWPAASTWFDEWRRTEVNRHLLFDLKVCEILVADSTVKELQFPYTGGRQLRQWIISPREGLLEEVPEGLDEMLGWPYTQVYTPDMLDR